MPWYYAESGQQIGPVDDRAFGELAESGKIHADTLVWRQGMSKWEPYRSVSAPAAVNGAPTDRFPLCSQCRQAFPPDELVLFADLYVCGACKPAFTQKLREGIQPLGRLRYAGFWIRTGAICIDAIILYLFGMILSGFWLGMNHLDLNDPLLVLRAEGLLIVIQLLGGIAYETWFVGKFGGTPGKIACNLRIVRADGSKVTYQRAFARYNATFVSTFTLGIGYIIAAFDEQKRTLHDYICDTRVIRK